MISFDEFVRQNALAESMYGQLTALIFVATFGLLFTWKWVARVLRLPSRQTNDQIDIPTLPLWITLLIALAARLPRMFEVLWYDELFSARVASLPFENLPTAIIGDVHPPLPYVIQWVTAQIFGTSEFTLRLPAFLCGLLMVALVWRLTYRLFGERPIADTAALISAVLPTLVYYGAEARQYMLLTCVIIGAAICILEQRGLLLMLLIGLLPWLHNIAYIYAGVLGVYGIFYHRPLWKPVAVGWVIGALWLPGLLLQSADVADGFWITQLSVGGLFYPLMRSTVGFSPLEYLPLVHVPMLALTFTAFWVFRRQWLTKHGLLLVVLLVGVPCLLALASWLWRPVYLLRAMLPVGVVIAIVLAWMISQSRYVMLRSILSVVLTLALLTSYERPRAIDYPALLSNCDDAQLYYLDIPAAMIGSYYAGEGVLWSNAGDLNQSLSPSAKQALQFQSGELPTGAVCIVMQDTPLTSGTARMQLMLYLHGRDYREWSAQYASTYIMRIYRLENNSDH